MAGADEATPDNLRRRHHPALAFAGAGFWLVAIGLGPVWAGPPFEEPVDGQLAYDQEASMWVPRSATSDWPADDRIGISVLDCLQCDGTGTVRLDPGRGHRPTRSGQ